jgi:hypothetical protein
MNKIIRIITVIILLFLAIGGLYGGWALINNPSGADFGWTLEILKGTPFLDFLVPGIILWLFNGLLPLFIAYLAMVSAKNHGWFVMMQGGILLIWLTTEIILNSQLYSPVLHPIFYFVSALLIICGFLLSRNK